MIFLFYFIISIFLHGIFIYYVFSCMYFTVEKPHLQIFIFNFSLKFFKIFMTVCTTKIQLKMKKIKINNTHIYTHREQCTPAIVYQEYRQD